MMQKIHKLIVLNLFYVVLTFNNCHAQYIYLLRHCETDWNKVEKLQSTSDIKLNKNGKLQAKEIGKKLSSKKYNINLIYTSPLSRSKQTADIIGNGLKLEPISDDSFKPAYAGKAIGLLPQEINKRFGSGTVEKWRNEDEIFDSFSYPDGESKIQVRDRAINKIRNILNDTRESDNILIITHGFTLKQIIVGFGFREQKYNKGIRNGEIVKLFYDKKNNIVHFVGRYSIINSLELK